MLNEGNKMIRLMSKRGQPLTWDILMKSEVGSKTIYYLRNRANTFQFKMSLFVSCVLIKYDSIP